MNLTSHRGTDQIGGTCIEVSSGATRILFDLGLTIAIDIDGTIADSRKIDYRKADREPRGVTGFIRVGQCRFH